MKKRRNWAPYLLILPSVLYLALFFAWPMVRAMTLAVWDESALLTLHSAASSQSPRTGSLPQGVPVAILDRASNAIEPTMPREPNLRTETWFQLRGNGQNGQTVEGWAPEARVRVRESDAAGRPLTGTIRRKLASDVDPLTDVLATPSSTAQLAGKLAANAPVEILAQAQLESWYLVRGENVTDPQEGWAQARYIQVYESQTAGRVARGDTGAFTLRYLQAMVSDRFFWPALWTTLLLMVLIIPLQFVLAIIMALIIQTQLRGNSFFLYVFTIALGVSDLAVGIVWYAIFTQYGYLNSILQGLGLISQPSPYLTADTRYWIIIAICLAELWRATAIVMVVVVSGLQAISSDILEAADLFGAGLWKRVRYVILPMLRPSLQVALILRTILALQVFAVVIALSGGDIVTVLANEAYRQYYDLRNINVAAAYAGLILLLSMVSAVFYLRTVRNNEEAAE